jgi:4-amino-4-deoxy-L-arabinose transferase-like glycosyltransferase
MAARSEISPASWRKPFLKFLDGVEAGWAIPLLLIGFVATWQAYLVIAYFGGDLHPDVLETWSYGRSLDWGYTKHPPLMGWIARAWTEIFPLANWSFQLLALTNSALALWAVDLIARRFVRGDKRIIVLLLVMLLPTYQFHAQRFNANTVLLVTWPIATYCFLRSFETRHVGWAIATGASAALAMLGKYYSAFLIASFVLAAICHPQRRAYFASWSPWIAACVGLAALTPHMFWLATTGAKPFHYAAGVHAGKDLATALNQTMQFIFGIALVMALPAATWVLMVQDRLKHFRQDFRAMDQGLYLLFLIATASVALPVVVSVGMRTDMSPVWALQGLFMFSILIVCGASFRIERFYTVNLLVFVIAIGLFCVFVAAPLHALYRNDNPLHEGRNFYQKSALALTSRWHQYSDVALPAVGGDDVLAFAAAFYSPDHPIVDESLGLVSSIAPQPATFEHGWAAMCFEGDHTCIATIERAAAPASKVIRYEFSLNSALLGQPGAAQRFTALIVPPAAEMPPPPPAATATADDFSARFKALQSD